MATLQTKQNKNALKIVGPEDVPGGRDGLRGAWWKWLTGLLMAYVCYGAFYIATGNVNFGASDNSARIVFFHVPCAILSYISYCVGFGYGLRYLLKRNVLDKNGTGVALYRYPSEMAPSTNLDNDTKAATAMELGLLFCTLATISGSIFAGMVWGSFWNWDPRETSIVIMLLLYASYLALRAAFADDADKRARLSAVYSIIALVPATFLIWAVPRIMASNHPTDTLQNPKNTSLEYKLVLYPAFLAFTLLFVWLFQLRCRVQTLIAKRQARI